jgi:hypothetical protein
VVLPRPTLLDQKHRPQSCRAHHRRHPAGCPRASARAPARPTEQCNAEHLINRVKGTSGSAHMRTFRRIAQETPRVPQQNQRQQKSHPPDQVQQDVSQPGAGTSTPIVDHRARPGMRPGGIRGIEAAQRHQQVGSHRHEQHESTLAQRSMESFPPARRCHAHRHRQS